MDGHDMYLSVKWLYQTCIVSYKVHSENFKLKVDYQRI